LDLLKFGKLLFLTKEEKEFDEQYQSWVKEIQSKLEPFRTQIQAFYLMDEYATQDLSHLLFNAFPIQGFDSKSYFKFLLNQSSDTLKTKLYEALVLSNQEKVEEHKNPIVFIQGLDLDITYKWQLLLMIENPLQTIQSLTQLMSQLEPLFTHYYESVSKSVEALGEAMTTELNTLGSTLIETWSQGRIKGMTIGEQPLNLLISGIYQYEVMINPKKDHLNLVWGLKMKQAFDHMNQAVENKLTERVTVFKNLGDKTRYEVIKWISTGMTSVKEIAAKVGVSSATISYHISELLKSKIIILENQNKKFSYVIDYTYLNEVIQDMKIDLDFPKP
jgi:DNA-binding transcriptional ArsR family regulator